MLYLAVKLRRVKQLQNPTIVVVTDRKDLDDQITKTFRKCGFPNPQQAESVKDLKRLLQQGPGSTIMTLVQNSSQIKIKTSIQSFHGRKYFRISRRVAPYAI